MTLGTSPGNRTKRVKRTKTLNNRNDHLVDVYWSVCADVMLSWASGVTLSSVLSHTQRQRAPSESASSEISASTPHQITG